MSSAVLDHLSYPAEAPKRRLQSPLTLRELLTPIFYYKWPALLAFLVPLAIALVAVSLAHTVYTSQTRLLTLLGGDYVFKNSANDPGSAQAFDRSQIVHAEMEILGTRALHKETINAVGLGRLYPKLSGQPDSLEKAADQLEKDLTIINIPTSSIIEMTFKARDRQVAADTLNKLVELYLQRRSDVFKRADTGSVSSQEAVLDGRLAQLEGQLTAFSTRYGFGDYTQEFSAVQTQQAVLQSQLQALDQQIATRAGRASQLSVLRRATPREVQVSSDRSRSTQLDALTQSLVALQAQRREAADKYRDGFPLITDLDQRIAEVQSQIRQAPLQQTSVERQGLNPVHQQIDTELVTSQGDVAGLRNGRGAIQRSLSAVNLRLAELVRIGPEYRALVRARDVVDGASQDLAKTAASAGVDNAVSRSRANVRVIQPAEPPTKGHTGRLILLLAGVAAGAAAAFATIVLAAATSQVMITPRDVEEKLGVPALLAVATGDDDQRPIGRALIPTHLTSDDGRLLLRLIASMPRSSGRVLQLIAAHDGEGVSSMVRDLAVIAAAGGARKVLLLDIEPPTGRGTAAMLAAHGHSLGAMTAERRTMRVDNSSLYVTAPLGAGGLKINEANWAKIIDAARTGFDLVLIDAPSLQRSSAGIEVAGLADLAIVVVEAEATRVAVAKRLVERLESAGGQVVGAILNKRAFYIPRFIYAAL